MLRHAAKSLSTPGWPPAPFYCSLLLALLWVEGSLAANLDTTPHHQGSVPAAAADWEAEELVVHVVAHTHDDVGWLKTVDQYYYGANNTIQEAGVQYILDSVIRELRLDPSKRFIYVEIAFFERWWAEQTEDMKEVVRELVSSGRLEFINGGWCMNDEATTHYEAIVDQMTSGHRFLLREFGVQPTIGWHIDPFGHASTQASLFALMGFNAFFFARIDYQDHAQRARTQEMEFIWRGSQSLGRETEMFTHVLYDHYGPPSGFCFECDNVDPIKDDPRLEGYNLHTRALQLVNNAKERRKVYRTNQIMMTFGDDFQFMNANINFKNMDKLIKYINANPQFGVKIMYSTPSLYIKAVHEVAESRNITWSVKTDDFFPYADYAHAYWTGYFTSRPALKGYVRSRANLLRGAERFYSVSRGILPSTDEDWALEHIQTLEYALAVAQHHDAVSGTEKQHVADDYAKQLSIGTEACEELMEQTLGQLLTKRGSLLVQEPLLYSNSRHVHSQLADPHPPLLTSCQYLNVSLCDPLTQALSQDRIVPLVITNPLAWNRSEYFAVPVPVGDFEVVDQYGQTIPSQLQKNVDRPGYLTLVFAVDVPALGYRSVVIQPSHSRLHAAPVQMLVMPDTMEQANLEISNDYFSVLVNQTTKRLSFIINKQTSQSLAMQQNLLWYNASIGNPESSQASGAYIFRPNSTNPLPLNGDGNTPDLLLLTSGPIFKEFQIKWNSWASQRIRLYERSPFVEFEYNIGPINITDQWGKEMITKFNTNISNAHTWYTDSEGQEMQQRRYNYRPTWQLQVNEPVAGNYYPINTAAYINDMNNDMRFTIVTDRSQGASSLTNGEFEVMLHRRLLHDDSRGVGEPLNETEAIRTVHRVFVGPATDSILFQREEALRLNNPCLLWFASDFDQGGSSAKEWFSTYASEFIPLRQSLPPNIHLQTLKPLDTPNQFLLRLNHIYAQGEHPKYSQPVQVNIASLFANFDVLKLEEQNLSANQPKSQVHRYSWKTAQSNAVPRHKGGAPPFTVVLSPMEIRTFILSVQPSP